MRRGAVNAGTIVDPPVPAELDTETGGVCPGGAGAAERQRRQ